ncbi:unnamed protein product [Allacma fusca]|uniref:Uncharacterized protein n=1 Tax=Allacma fusca TaxID=39272 RepID=A0A8J2NQ05_9HEXA|nr:unnamed protein product [Allacma fusca]
MSFKWDILFCAAIFLFHFHIVIAAKTGQEIPCRLKWQKSTSVSNPQQVAVLVEEKSKQAIIRSIQNQVAIVGRYDIDSDEGAIIPDIRIAEDEFEIVYSFLTNPEGCTLEWVNMGSKLIPEFSVRADEFSPPEHTFVGRQKSRNTNWLPGHIDAAAGLIYVSVKNSTEEFELGDFQILTSYSAGIDMEVTDVVFERDPFDGPADFMGVDNIFNYGPGEVTVSVEHRKQVTETYTITIQETWVTKTTHTFTLGFKWFKFQRKSVNTVTDTKTETYTTEEETEFKVTQEVTVPPYTSVKACSTIKMSEKQEVEYNANVKYSAIGRTPEEIRALVAKDTDLETEIRADGGVYLSERVRGNFTADVALITNFQVLPYDSEQNCTSAAGP